MANETVTAVPKAVLGPETLDSGARKWTVVLDNGSQVVTFSEKAYNAVNTHIDKVLTIEVEKNDKGWPPKILSVSTPEGSKLWEPAAAGSFGGGGGRNENAETARRAVGSAVAIVSSWQAADITAGKTPFTGEEMVKLIEGMAPGIFTLMKDLERE